MKSFIRLLPAVGLLLVLPEFRSAHAAEPPTAPTATQTQKGDAASPSRAPSDTSAPAEPSASPTQPQAVDSSAHPAASPEAKPNRVVLMDKTLTDSQVKQLLARGYKPQQRGDSIYYCRREQVLGSHFENKVCKTAEEIARDERDSKEMVERMRRANGGNPNMAP